MVVCRFRTQVTDVQKLVEGMGRTAIILWGGMSDFHSTRELAEKLPDCVVIVQADCSAGYELKSFEAIIFASCSYSYVAYEQMLGRIRAIGKTSPCLYLFLTCGKIGGKVLENVRLHRDFTPDAIV